MASSTRAKALLNTFLRPLNLRVDTLTAERREAARIAELSRRGHFRAPVFPLPAAIERCDPKPVLDAVDRHAARMAELRQGAGTFGYSFDNDYFRSPDAEVYYAIIRQHRPRRIVEVGCGNSTRLARQAIADGGLATELICVDPAPRLGIESVASEIVRAPVESLTAPEFAARLGAGDILFIDSSHELRAGNDVVFLYLHVLPLLAEGVLVHIHDVFLPYDYPEGWVSAGFEWNEQYLVQMLLGNDRFEVLWPGYFLQQTRQAFAAHFPGNGKNHQAQSLWLRRRAPGG